MAKDRTRDRNFVLGGNQGPRLRTPALLPHRVPASAGVRAGMSPMPGGR